jgi:nitrate reductase gamma subunit
MPPAGLFDKKSSAENKQAIAIGAYAFGGVAVAAGVTLFVLNRPTLVRIKPKSAEEGVSVTPVVSPHLTGVAASGHF